MPAPATFIGELLDHHLDELGFLWGRWRASLRDPDYTLRGVGDLEERILGHLDGVRAPGEQARPRLIELLEGDDPDLLFAAAHSLLQTGWTELGDELLDAFEAAEGDAHAALGEALAHGPLPSPALARLRALLSLEPKSRAIGAAEVLTFHGSLGLSGEQLGYFLKDEDASVRVAGWNVAALLGVPLAPEAYAAALRDPDPSVPPAALEAGAWCGEPGVLSALRHLAGAPSPDRLDSLYLLAVLAGPEDLPLMEELVGTADLGPGRFRLAGALGAPELMPLVLPALEDPDPATAAAAGAAFMKITGVDIESDSRAPVPPPDGSEPDEFEAEFLDEVTLPDPETARRRWAELAPDPSSGTRLCRGVGVDDTVDGRAMPHLDMESRWEAHLRSRFRGAWSGSPLDLERFPQAAAAGG